MTILLSNALGAIRKMRSGGHVYSLCSHQIAEVGPPPRFSGTAFRPKYRRRSFYGPSRERLIEIFHSTCAERDWIIRGLEVMPDHVHIFVSCPPKWSPSDIAKILKGVSARLLLQEFPELKRRGHLWTNAYYVGSAGNISADVIQRYIAGQRKGQVDDGA